MEKQLKCPHLQAVIAVFLLWSALRTIIYLLLFQGSLTQGPEHCRC